MSVAPPCIGQQHIYIYIQFSVLLERYNAKNRSLDPYRIMILPVFQKYQSRSHHRCSPSGMMCYAQIQLGLFGNVQCKYPY